MTIQPGATEPQTLIERSKAGDTTAFAELFHSHHRRIYTLCLRMTGDTANAEDLTQDTFVQAWRRLADFRGTAKFSTWLHRIAVNTVISHSRKHRFWLTGGRESADDLPELADSSASPGTIHDLESAILQLPERARQVFVLVDVEGYSHEETASILRIATGTSKAHLFRARSILRELLQ